jgi:hypothetical protein
MNSIIQKKNHLFAQMVLIIDPLGINVFLLEQLS